MQRIREGAVPVVLCALRERCGTMKGRKHLWLPGTDNMLKKLVLKLYGPRRCSRIHLSDTYLQGRVE